MPFLAPKNQDYYYTTAGGKNSLDPSPGPVMYKISAPMGGGLSYITGVEAENSAVNFSKEAVQALDKNLKGAQTMKCKLWTETLEFWRLKVPNSRFALHGLAPP